MKIMQYAMLLCLLLSQAATANEETLYYRVSYKGIFSAGAEVGLADAVMRTYYPGKTRDYLETRIEASSANYPAVEALYPIRYRFSTWYKADASAGIAGEYHERNQNRPVKHVLIELDHPNQPFILHDLVKTRGLMGLPLLSDGHYVVQQQGAKRFDRLSMLQHLRSLPLKVGDTKSISVTNGKMMMRYQIKVEAAQTLDIGKKTYNSLKIRVDGYKPGKNGQEQASHRPAYLWLADDAKKTMLRIELRLRYGHFGAELQTQPVAFSVQ